MKITKMCKKRSVPSTHVSILLNVLFLVKVFLFHVNSFNRLIYNLLWL